jgi:hypothetical protein
MGPWSQSGNREEERNVFPLPGIESWLSSPIKVTTDTVKAEFGYKLYFCIEKKTISRLA